MATYTAITNAQVEPKAPVTSELMSALRDNPIAIAEAATGSPTMEQAWHELEVKAPASDTDLVTMATDISSYRAIRIIGGAECLASTSVTTHSFDVDLFIGGAWQTVALPSKTTSSTSRVHTIFDLHVDNVDNNDSSNQRVITGIFSIEDATGTRWDTENTYYGAYSLVAATNNVGSCTAIRIRYNQGDFDVSEGTPNFRLYGVKRV